ncbi:HNH endonuclease signature motif containing protein [Salininema proteolyticum]|uniref:DUF222 domain-containing protein n=1 Tax=Salininema proteolyticum TaxID=1607685 RepID=A0ABV8U4D8_9ACTN
MKHFDSSDQYTTDESSDSTHIRRNTHAAQTPTVQASKMDMNAAEGRPNPITDPHRAAPVDTLARKVSAALTSSAHSHRNIERQILRNVITAVDHDIPTSSDGMSCIRDWLSTYGLHPDVARNVSTIAVKGKKYPSLKNAALDGTAGIHPVARAMTALESGGAALRHAVHSPYKAGPQVSPYDNSVQCLSPADTVLQHCIHAPDRHLREHLDHLKVTLTEELSTQEEHSEQALQYVNLTRTPTNMYSLDGLLSQKTGSLLQKFFTSAIEPPRAADAARDEDRVLPSMANARAEALHQAIASYAAHGDVPVRHGHTATLSLTADLDTLRGAPTGRIVRLEGSPISIAQARALACDADVIPGVFDYGKGELVDLGTKKRLANLALRRKLEAEQPDGCVWPQCSRPVHWLEHHHIEHWVDGGPTSPENLVLACRHHHGRFHTGEWSIAKHGPGRFTITHVSGRVLRADTLVEPIRRRGNRRAFDNSVTADETFEKYDALPIDLLPQERAPMYRPMINAAVNATESRRIDRELSVARRRIRQRQQERRNEATQSKPHTTDNTCIHSAHTSVHRAGGTAIPVQRTNRSTHRPPYGSPSTSASSNDDEAELWRSTGWFHFGQSASAYHARFRPHRTDGVHSHVPNLSGRVVANAAITHGPIPRQRHAGTSSYPMNFKVHPQRRAKVSRRS